MEFLDVAANPWFVSLLDAYILVTVCLSIAGLFTFFLFGEESLRACVAMSIFSGVHILLLLVRVILLS